MRIAALAFVSLLALGACNPSASTNSDAPAAANDATFPQASGVAFRQEATLTMGGQSIAQVIYHDGARIRTEMPSPTGGSMTSIVNSETHEAISIIQIGGRTIATRTDLSQVQSGGASQPVDLDALRAQMQARTHRIGSCSAGGESGSEWSVDPPAEVQAPAVARSMCLTQDGIMIQMKQDGVVVFDTQSLQRGPQDASLFTVPPGVQVTEQRLPSRESVNAAIERARAAAAQHSAP